MGNGRTHRPDHNPVKCSACGGCTWRCPATLLTPLRSEKGSLRGALYTARPYPGEPADKPPCALACPLGQDVPGYVSAIARGDIESAARIIRETNALPAACGRLCIASCMRACSRASIDEGVDIRGLKRFAVGAVPPAPVPATENIGGKVAIVGGGPAGLSAALFLARRGVGVTVFESQKTAGGMLADTVPSFAMPEDALAVDINAIAAAGVQIRTGVRVGAEISAAELEKEFDAVLVCTGARRGLVPAMEGSALSGAVDAVTFCREARRNPAFRVQGDVVVVGGGATALLTARLALAHGATSASVVHPAPRAAWPAGEGALALAEASGVAVLAERRVVGLEGRDGKLAAATVQTVRLGAKDRVGRTALGTGAKQSLPAAVAVFTVDRRPDDGLAVEGASRGVLGNFAVDGSYRLGRARWYAAGEAATGAATLVDSMATGKRAAACIAADLLAKTGVKK